MKAESPDDLTGQAAIELYLSDAEAELIASECEAIRSGPRVLILWVAMAFAVFGVFAVIALFALLWIGFLYLAAAAAFVVAILLAIMKRRAAYLVREKWRRLHCGALLRLDHEGVHLSNKSQNVNLKWSFFESAIEREETFVLYSGNNSITVIPKRVAAVDHSGALRAQISRFVPVTRSMPSELGIKQRQFYDEEQTHQYDREESDDRKS